MSDLVNRLRRGGYSRNDLLKAAARIEALERALETIAEGRDAGRHDGKPEEYPAHDADTMFALARAALNQRGDNE